MKRKYLLPPDDYTFRKTAKKGYTEAFNVGVQVLDGLKENHGLMSPSTGFGESSQGVNAKLWRKVSAK